MTFRSLVLAFLLPAFFAFASPSFAANSRAGKPNVILVMADDMGYGDVGYNGHKTLKTPHLDAMAANGLRFNRFYAAAPVCSPTRGSALTGRHPSRYGIFGANNGHMRDGEHTLAELLKQQGYATGHFGKWHLGTLSKTVKESNRGGPGGVEHYAPPWEHGFDVCFATEAKTPTFDPMWRPNASKGNTWWDPLPADTDPAKHARPYNTHYWTGPGAMAKGNLRGDDSRVIMDRAIPFIRDAARADKPFFAVVWFHAPHLPVVAGPKHTAMYKDHDKHTQHYFGCITALDEQVGRLRNELRTLGVADDTMLFFCSDNGPEGNDKSPGSTKGLRGRKRSLFEGGVRVPGLLEWPAKIKTARATDHPASTSDYLPTVLDVLGVKLPDRPYDGESLLPVIEGKRAERARPIAFESRGQIALVGNQFKLIHVSRRGRNNRNNDDADRDFMLFDLHADPAESKDIADWHKDVVKRMSDELTKWQASCKASLEGKDYE